jgi:hypothetical protein
LRWKDASPEFAEQYARARTIGYELEFEDLDDIASEVPPTTAAGATDTGFVAWQRVRIDTKKWSLSKKLPKKYGDKLDLNHGGGINMSITPVENEL